MSFQADKTIVLRSIPLLPDALHWSPGDTHLVAVTHSHLHLLTPSPCATHFAVVTLPPPILLAAAPSSSDTSQLQSQSESRTRPLLPRDTKSDTLVLPGDVLPSAWRLARWSPRSASGLGSLLAAVDYAGRLVIYAQVLARGGSGAGGLPGGGVGGGGGSDAWRLVHDWTPLVSHHLYLARRVRRSATVDPAQRGVKVTPRDAMVASIAWRPNLLHDDHDHGQSGKAVLAVGTMAGHVSVWVCDMQSGHGEPVAMWHLATLNDTNDQAGTDDDDDDDDNAADSAQFNKPSTLPWVTLLSWSPTGDYLAYALSNGEFGVLQTTFTPPAPVPESLPDSVPPPPTTWSITAQPQGRLFSASIPSQHDPRMCTALAWCSPTHVALAKGAAAIVLWDVTDPGSVVETPLVAPDGGAFVANVSVLVPLVPEWTQGVLGVQAYTVDGHVFVVTVKGEVRRDLAWLARRGFLGKHGIDLPEDWRLGGGGRPGGVARAEDAGDDENEHENEGENDGDGEEDGDEAEGGDLKVPGLNNKMVRYHGAATSKNGAVTAVLYTIFPTNELIYRTERFTNTYIDLVLTPCITTSSVPLTPLITRLESALHDAALAIGARALLWDVVYVTNLHPDWKPIVLDAMHMWSVSSAAAGDTHTKRRVQQWMFMLHAAAAATAKRKSAPTDTVRDLAVGLLVSHWLAALAAGDLPVLTVLRVSALVRSLAQEPFVDAACVAGLAELAGACALALRGEADDKIRTWASWLLALAERLRAGGSVGMTDAESAAATELVLVDPCPVCGETADVLVDPDTMGLVSLCKNKHRITRCCLTLAILATPKCCACTGCAKTKAVATIESSADNTCPMCADRLLWSGRVPLALPPLPIPTLADPLPMGDSDSDADATAAAAAAKTPAKRGRKSKALGGSATVSSPVPPANASDDDDEGGEGTPAASKAHRSAAKPRALTEPVDMDKISRALEVERAKKGKRRATVGIPLDGDEAQGGVGGEASVKKRRGRPPKNKEKQDADAEEDGQAESVAATPTPTPKRRGRPPKNPAAAATPEATPSAATEPKRRGRQPKTPAEATSGSAEPKRRGRPSKAKTPAAAAADGQEMDEAANGQEQQHPQQQISSTSAAAALMALASAPPAQSGDGIDQQGGDGQQGAVAPPETPSVRGGRGRGRGGARGGSGTGRGRGRGRGTPAAAEATPTPAPTATKASASGDGVHANEQAESGAAGSEPTEQAKDADGDVVMGDG